MRERENWGKVKRLREREELDKGKENWGKVKKSREKQKRREKDEDKRKREGKDERWEEHRKKKWVVREFEKEKDERDVGMRFKRELWIMGSKSTFEIYVCGTKEQFATSSSVYYPHQ